MKLTRVLARLAALVLFALVLSPRDAKGVREEAGPHDVLIVGSSSVNGALGVIFESELERAGFQVGRRGRSSSGFARPDFFDWQAEIARLGDLRRLHGVLVYAGGNDGQAIRLPRTEVPAGATDSQSWVVFRDESRWATIYRERVRVFVDTLCAGGVRRVAVLLPVDGENESWTRRMRRIQALQAEAVASTRCGVVADPRGARVAPGTSRDGVHLGREGALAIWQHVGPTIVRAFRP